MEFRRGPDAGAPLAPVEASLHLHAGCAAGSGGGRKLGLVTVQGECVSKIYLVGPSRAKKIEARGRDESAGGGP
jgi:hypothetical protein